MGAEPEVYALHRGTAFRHDLAGPLNKGYSPGAKAHHDYHLPRWGGRNFNLLHYSPYKERLKQLQVN